MFKCSYAHKIKSLEKKKKKNRVSLFSCISCPLSRQFLNIAGKIFVWLLLYLINFLDTLGN